MVVFLLFFFAAASIRFDAASQHFTVSGWDKNSEFAVYVERSPPGSPPLLGSSEVQGDSLVFRPRFALQPGLGYRAVLKTAAGEIVERFEIPKPAPVSTTYVAQVYPSAAILPENQLKFYVHFSAPMSRGEAPRRIRLLDENGVAVELPFLELDEELWDPEWKRLTLLFDPGRVKRGLMPRQEVGGALVEGRRYSLVIDAAWPDAAGNPLREAFRKDFRVGPADRLPIDPKRWRVKAPKAGTRDPLVADFGEPLDRALLDRLLSVPGVAGSIRVDREETRWQFTPRDSWKPGRYELRIGTALEDLAGNKVGRPFDIDVFERVKRRITSDSVSLPFRVAPASPRR